MKNKLCYHFLLCAFLCFALSNIKSQAQVKELYKTPPSFISISFLDIKSRSIPLNELIKLENSYLSFSDHSIIQEFIINAFLFESAKSIDTLARINDLSYLKKTKNCPVLGLYRPSDPLLMVFGVFLSHVAGYSNMEGMILYQHWQQKNVPHSPLGDNNPSTNLSDVQKLNWGLKYTQNWVSKYPEEYVRLLKEFDTCSGQWQKVKNFSSNIEMIKQLAVDFFGTGNNPVSQLMNFSSYKPESVSPKVDLPSDSVLHNDPYGFITDSYEKLYLRTPSKEEIDYLTQFISQHRDLTVKEFYYALMTSDEYKYY